MSTIIDARPLSGFQDMSTEDTLFLEQTNTKLKNIFQSYGYIPIDTPCIYRYETLTGGEANIDKQLFEWNKRNDEGAAGERLALRFDLTVPLARYVAVNLQSLTLPFKRYEIGKVWRGERPQKGRYREFYQCDFDFIGTDSLSADIETLLLVDEALAKINTPRYVIKINDRAILDGLLEALYITSDKTKILQVLDKMDKLDDGTIYEELTSVGTDKSGIGLTPMTAMKLIDAIRSTSMGFSNSQVLKALLDSYNNVTLQQGVNRLKCIVTTLQKIRPSIDIQVDFSIVRGLGYYTGMVFETILVDTPEIGSIASGGRYDNLTSSFTRQKLSGVGASIGLSRILPFLNKEDLKKSCKAMIAIEPSVDPVEAFKLADQLRAQGIDIEVYPQLSIDISNNMKLSKQLKYSNNKGYDFTIILAPDELQQNSVILKNMKLQTQQTIKIVELKQYLIG